MQVPLLYDFKYSPHINHSCQCIVGISKKGLKNVNSLFEYIYGRISNSLQIITLPILESSTGD